MIVTLTFFFFCERILKELVCSKIMFDVFAQLIIGSYCNFAPKITLLCYYSIFSYTITWTLREFFGKVSIEEL